MFLVLRGVLPLLTRAALSASSIPTTGCVCQGPAELFLPAQDLDPLAAMAQGGSDLGRVGAGSRNRSQ